MVGTRVTAEGRHSVPHCPGRTRSEPTLLALMQQRQNSPDEGGERWPPLGTQTRPAHVPEAVDPGHSGTGSRGTGCERGATSQALATRGLAPCRDS